LASGQPQAQQQRSTDEQREYRNGRHRPEIVGAGIDRACREQREGSRDKDETDALVGRAGMAARPSWRGQIKLALVSIPVEIYPATKAGKSIAFHQVHEPSGQRVRYEKVVPGIGPVDRDEILKGYEVSKGEYVLLDPEEIEKVKLESRKTLELTQFVDLRPTSTRSISTSPIMSRRPTTWPRKPSSSCATRSRKPRRSASASWPCAARNMSSA
jgi:hypothetical protein